MSIRYKAVKQISGFDKTATGKYAVKAVTGETLTFDNVCTQVTRACGAHRGTAPQVTGGLFDVIANHLDREHSFGQANPARKRTAQKTGANGSA